MRHLHALKLHITLVKLAAEIVACLADSKAHLFVAQAVNIQLKAIDRAKLCDMKVYLIFWSSLGRLLFLLVVIEVTFAYGMRMHVNGRILGPN